MLLPIISISLGFFLIYITKHGWSGNPFQRPASRREIMVVRIISIVGIALTLYGIIRLIKTM